MNVIKNIKKMSKIVASLSKSPKKPCVSAVILAGGSSERMNGVSKQLELIDGIPVVIMSVIAYEKCPDIDKMVIVCRESEIDEVRSLIEKNGIKKPVDFAIGGKTRFESMIRGFEKTDVKSDIIAVHDAARCLVTPENISDVISAAKKYGAAIAASKTTDTIKVTDENGNIKSTVDRSVAWNAQTPQAFLRPLLEVGIYTREDGENLPTDDAMLVEKLGFRVHVVDCGYDNIKITTRNDLIIAETIIKRRNENGKEI